MFTQKARKPFTPGWDTTMDTEMALPIKRGNQVIPVVRKAKRKEISDEDIDERIVADDDELEDENGDENQPKEDDRPKVKKMEMDIDLSIKSPAEQMTFKQTIGEMCSAITANPEESVLKKQSKSISKAAENPDFITYSFKDLLAFTNSKDPVELELIMLSITLVFKDICPGYRIRSAIENKDENGNHVQLKKETKRLYDFERNLLHFYQQFLYILDKRASWGLVHLAKGRNNVDANATPAYRAVKQSLGLTALRCQCELLKSLVHFNFHSMLLNSIVSRASTMYLPTGSAPDASLVQVQQDVVVIVAEALEFILRHDTTGEISYEFVMLMNKLLKVTKTTLDPRILQCLETIKVTVKADDAYLLKFKAKQEKKKRKNDESKVEIGLLEANLVNDDVSKKRFQVNSLQEMSLLYFRILKMKPTEPNQKVLLPMALAGLGRITHLINVDHVVDLMTILRGILDQGGATPIAVRLLCLVCALKTLSGPGELLQIDDEPYLQHLHQVMMDLPKVFDHWVSLFDCIDVYFVERREEKMPLVEKTILLLTILATSHLDSLIGSVLLTMAHSLLLRYPRARQSMALWQYAVLLLSSATGPTDVLSGKVKVKIFESSAAAAAAALLTNNKRAAYASVVTQGGNDEDEEGKFFEEDGRMEDLAMRGLVDGTAVLRHNKKHNNKHVSQKLKKTKQQKKFAQRAHSQDAAIANMYATWDTLQGLDIREQMVRLLATVLVKSQERNDQPRFRRIVNAMCQQDLVPLPLSRDDLDGTYAEILQRGKKTLSQQPHHQQQQQQQPFQKQSDATQQTHSRKVVSFLREDNEEEEEDDDDGDDVEDDDKAAQGARRKHQQNNGKKGGKSNYNSDNKHGDKNDRKKSFGHNNNNNKSFGGKSDTHKKASFGHGQKKFGGGSSNNKNNNKFGGKSFGKRR